MQAKLPSETDEWSQETFRRPDGSFDVAAYCRWREEEERRLLGPIVVTPRDVWMSVWLQRIVTEANMFYGMMIPLLPSYYEHYDEVPWEDMWLWQKAAEIMNREREKQHARRRNRPDRRVSTS